MGGEYLTREEHIEFAKRMEDEHNRQNRRIELLEENLKEMQKLAIFVEKMDSSIKTKMDCMLEEQTKQGERLEALEEAPKKNIDAFRLALIGAIGAAVGSGMIAAISNFFIGG